MSARIRRTRNILGVALVLGVAACRGKELSGTVQTPLQKLDALLAPGAVRLTDWADVAIDHLELRTWDVGGGAEIAGVFAPAGSRSSFDGMPAVLVAANGTAKALAVTTGGFVPASRFVPLTNGGAAVLGCADVGVVDELGVVTMIVGGIPGLCTLGPSAVAGTATGPSEYAYAIGFGTFVDVAIGKVTGKGEQLAKARAEYPALGTVVARYVREVTPGVVEWVVSDPAGANPTYGRSDTTTTHTTAAFAFPPSSEMSAAWMRAEPSGALLFDRGGDGASIVRWHVESDGSVEVVATPDPLPAGFSAWSKPHGFGAAHASLTRPNDDDPEKSLTVPIAARARAFGSDGKYRVLDVPPTPCRETDACRTIGESYLLGVTTAETAPVGIYAVWGWQPNPPQTVDPLTGRPVRAGYVTFVAARLDRTDAPPPVTRLCVPGSARCTSGSLREVCVPDGSYWRPDACSGATPVCAGSVCGACTDAATQCPAPADTCFEAACTATGCGTKVKALGTACTNLAGKPSVCTATGCGACTPGETSCGPLLKDTRCGPDAQPIEAPCPAGCGADFKCNVIPTVATLAAGAENTCALMSNKTLRCWGRIPGGVVKPTPLTLPQPGVDEITLGGGHACVRVQETVFCWGTNTIGQVGNGKAEQVYVPPTASLPGVLGDAIQISAGGDHTCAVQTTGQMRCWGANSSGECGTGTDTPTEPIPAAVNLAGSKVFGGGAHSCAISFGGAECWGRNDAGQLGNANASSRFGTPSGVAPTLFALGTQHSCALVEAGAIRCWGANDRGQLGTGDVVGGPAPVTPLRALTAASLVVGGHTTFAVRADGTVVGWGANDVGQLGVGAASPAPTTTPLDLTSVGTVVQLVAGTQHACALYAEGIVKCWGSNAQGQLGDGTKLDRASPTDVVF